MKNIHKVYNINKQLINFDIHVIKKINLYILLGFFKI